MLSPYPSVYFFFFNDTATTEIYTLSLHDALPIFRLLPRAFASRDRERRPLGNWKSERDRKSTRLNSSHSQISYAVFCLKKKNDATRRPYRRPVRRPTDDPVQHVPVPRGVAELPVV